MTVHDAQLPQTAAAPPKSGPLYVGIAAAVLIVFAGIILLMEPR
jgi:hypothetical protein